LVLSSGKQPLTHHPKVIIHLIIMKTRLLYSLCALSIVVGPAHATGVITVDFSAALGERFVTTADGTPLEDGNEVRIGTFASDFDIAANVSDFSALDTAFTEFDTASIVSTIGPSSQPGSFVGSDSQLATGFEGERIYIWVFRTTENTAPYANYENVQEHGIFTNTALTNWLFPSSTDTFPTTLVTTTEIETAVTGAIVHDYGDHGAIRLAVVPEPARTTLLLAVAILACLFWRHRRPPSRL